MQTTKSGKYIVETQKTFIVRNRVLGGISFIALAIDPFLGPWLLSETALHPSALRVVPAPLPSRLYLDVWMRPLWSNIL